MQARIAGLDREIGDIMADLDRQQAAALGLRTTLIGVVLNGTLAAVKGAAGVMGNSYALVADAIESTSDIAQSLIVYAGLKVAVTPRDEDHPYGHGKAEPLAVVAVAIGLAAAALIIMVQSAREIHTPHHAPAPFTLAVLAVVIIAKETLFRYAFQVAKEAGSSVVRADAWHHRSDALTSAAAFLGIGIALLGGPGFESADDWAAMFAGCIILWNAWLLLRPAVAELMDAATSPEVEAEVRRAAAGIRGVLGTEKCFVRKMGFDFFVDLHVLVDGDATVRQGHDIAHRVKDAVRAALPRVTDVLIHVEPPEHAD